MTDAAIEAINTEAAELIQRGSAFLQEPRREAPIDALHCFDEALELRRRVPADHSPRQRFLLAICLLNRADALIRMADAGPVAAALAANDEGLALLRQLPLAEDPLYPRALAMALRNRGLALQARGAEGDGDAAAAAFADALAVLDRDDARGIDDIPALRAVLWLHVANIHATQPSEAAPAAARTAALHALESVAGLETDDVNAAAMGLQARHLLCRVCAHGLAQAGDEEMPEHVHQATDAVDDGLEIIRAWEQRGVPHFRPFAFELFRFGARVYARYQPQFLEEFIEDNMNADTSSAGYVESPEMAMAAEEARQLLEGETGQGSS